MVRFGLVGGSLALLFLGWQCPEADLVDFEPPAYAVGRVLQGMDGWTRAVTNNGDSSQFKVESNTTSAYLHVQPKDTYAVSRIFRPAARAIELKWRWRFDSIQTNQFCLGIGTEADTMVMRVKICVYPNQSLQYQTASGSMLGIPHSMTSATWHYMRLVVDGNLGSWSLFASTTVGREKEQALLGPIAFLSVGPLPTAQNIPVLSRLFLRQEGDNTRKNVDLDDFDWARADYKRWVGLALDSNWSSSTNWNPVGVPESTDVVLFPAGVTRGMMLDRHVSVQGIVVQNAYAGTLNFDNFILNLTGNGDFAGGKYRYQAGILRLSSPSTQILIGPVANAADVAAGLPPVRHDGAGTVQLAVRPLTVRGWEQTHGNLDFNGQDLIVNGDLKVNGSLGITKATPYGLMRLDGRNIKVSGNASFEGRENNLIGLLATTTPFSLAVTGNLTAKYASIGQCKATVSRGIATYSDSLKGAENWTFKRAPTVKIVPDTLGVYPGQTATFNSEITHLGDGTLTWYVNDAAQSLANKTIHLIGVTLADHSKRIVCKVTNSTGTATSNTARLSVSFPAPVPSTHDREFSGTLQVGFNALVENPLLFVSQNDSPFERITGTVTLTKETELRVYAVLGSDTSAMGLYRFTSTDIPKLARPIATPRGREFPDSITVALKSPDSAEMFFTLDGSKPTEALKPYAQPLILRQTAELTVIATRKSYRSSDTLRELYLDTLESVQPLLEKPIAQPAAGAVADGTSVRFSSGQASIWWRKVGGVWTWQMDSALVIHQNDSVEAVAVQGTKRSAIAKFTYLLESGPRVSPTPGKFHDSIQVELTTRDGSKIYADTNKVPTQNGTLPYSQPYRFFNTTVLHAFSVSTSGKVSDMQTWVYQLEPQIPVATPGGNALQATGKVTLSTPTRLASLYYTLDGQDPTPGNWIPYFGPIAITKSLTLKAVAVTGRDDNEINSAVMTEQYRLTEDPKQTEILPGQQGGLAGEFRVVVDAKAKGPIALEAVDLPSYVVGFQLQSSILQIKGISGDSTVTVQPTNAALSNATLWFLADGFRKPTRIAGGSPFSPASDGKYFFGKDTLPPVIRLSGETINADGSTAATFTLDDNAATLGYQVYRSDLIDSVVKVKDTANAIVIKLSLKNPPGAIKILGVRVCAQGPSLLDSTCLPKCKTGWFPVRQRTQGFTTGPVWKVGSHVTDKWDFVGLPFRLDTSITVESLIGANDRSDLTLAQWEPSGKDSLRYLNKQNHLVEGKAYWVASSKALESVTLGQASLLTSGDSAFRFTLKEGWNAIASKLLDSLAWPMSRKKESDYKKSKLKSLWAYHPGDEGNWVKTEVLAPWRGYFVYWKGPLDTVVDLDRATPSMAGMAAKAAAVDKEDWVLGMSQDRSEVELGAFDGASEAFGIEDEPALLSRSKKATQLAALRKNLALSSDFQGLAHQGLLRWTVGWRSGSKSDLKLVRRQLPSGYGVAAFSPKRGLAFDLDANPVLAATPLGFEDTLQIIVGKVEEVQAALAQWPQQVQIESARLQGRHLSLRLLGNRYVTLEALDAQGRLLGREQAWWPAGQYQWSLSQLTQGRRGLVWLRLRLEGEGKRVQKAFLLPLP